MLTKEAQIKGRKIATQKLREKAISSIGETAIQVILQCRQEGMTLRAIAERLNSEGYKTMKGKPFQQAQIKRTLDRVKQMDIRINESVTKHPKSVTKSPKSVTSALSKVVVLKDKLEKYEARIEALQAENEKLQQVDIEEEITNRKLSALKKVLEPYQQLLRENINPNQPRLKKMVELLEAIEKVL